ncbi:MAG: hypothetical protein IT162_08175 [Bryobacterales bacterium]|nr:hypothetical protein [Bryobacterales bacterium]
MSTAGQVLAQELLARPLGQPGPCSALVPPCTREGGLALVVGPTAPDSLEANGWRAIAVPSSDLARLRSLPTGAFGLLCLSEPPPAHRDAVFAQMRRLAAEDAILVTTTHRRAPLRNVALVDSMMTYGWMPLEAGRGFGWRALWAESALLCRLTA